jgi:CubicO group peptidase (beta-lactamase class C family)
MRAIPLLLVIGLLQFPAPVLSPSDQVYARFGEYLEALRSQAGIPGMAAAVIGENDILWERPFGQQDIGRTLATSPDTPFHFDGLMQIVTTSMVLKCVEDGRVSLDATIAEFDPDNPDGGSTIADVLSQTTRTPSGLVFNYQPNRLDPMRFVVRACTGNSFRETTAALLDRLAMIDSVPGMDAMTLIAPAEGVTDTVEASRYAGVLARLATSYTVDASGGATPAVHPDATLTPEGGLISTARDYAKFDVALRQGVIVGPEMLARAWQTPLDWTGTPVPHGLGWFVQSYNGETVVWQFGMTENASSSLVVTVPSRGLTLILLANSDGLVKPFALANGDLTTSPFAKVFLGLIFP